MNTYYFRYETVLPTIEELVLFECRAKNLSFALRTFWLQSKDFLCPVKRLSTIYEIMNDKGKRSTRLLKDNVKVYPYESRS